MKQTRHIVSSYCVKDGGTHKGLPKNLIILMKKNEHN